MEDDSLTLSARALRQVRINQTTTLFFRLLLQAPLCQHTNAVLANDTLVITA